MTIKNLAGVTVAVSAPAFSAVARSGNDAIISELTTMGFTTGTINDREYARLLALTGKSAVGHSIADLYFLAGERPRL